MRQRLGYGLGLVVATITVNLSLWHWLGGCALDFLRGGKCTNYRDNIGAVDMEWRLAFEPIDVVYTWVNGSDPVWKAAKNKYNRLRTGRKLLFDDDYDDWAGYNQPHYYDDSEPPPVFEHNVTNETTATTDTKNETVEEVKDDAASESRYRDSEELRYSLRSLEMFAPWVRKVFIVTDNQIPYWLNLEDSKVKIVPHSAIFADRRNLPVFSSPAIESQLHRVPGVSRRFVYFNDDVMLGSPTFPDDFVRLDGAQRVYLAWDAPKCNDGCQDSWLGDGTCDTACNVSSCDFDLSDCEDPSPLKPSKGRKKPLPPKPVKKSKKVPPRKVPKKCVYNCVKNWLADGSCDAKCDVAACLHDVGDCGPLGVDAAPPGQMVIDVPRTDYGAVVNVSHVVTENDEDIVAYLEDDLVYDVFVLRKAGLFVLMLDQIQSRRLVSAAEPDPTFQATGIAHNWTATLEIRRNGTSRSFTYLFRLFDPLQIQRRDANKRDKRRLRPNYRPASLKTHVASCDGPVFVDFEPGRAWEIDVTLDNSTRLDECDGLVVLSVATHSKFTSKQYEGATVLPHSARLAAPLLRFDLERLGDVLRVQLPVPAQQSWTRLLSFDDVVVVDNNASGVLATWMRRATENKYKNVGLSVVGTLFVLPRNATTKRTVERGVDDAIACVSFSLETLDARHVFDDDDAAENINRGRRLLLDTYGESLARVNRLYTKRYGKLEYNAARRVPAHMPHMIDTQVMRAMQAEWRDEWARTAANRFRSGTDMQFAFAYFHYVMSKARIAEPDFDEIWRHDIDVDGDGVLDGNEIITLASLALGKEPRDEDIREVYDCVATHLSVPRSLSRIVPWRRADQKSDRQRQWETKSPRVATLDSTKRCDTVVADVKSRYKQREERRAESYIIEDNLNEVAFEMLGDDYDVTRSQLDSIRARRVKFICINDNINAMTTELFGLLTDFFQAYYPRASRFELPKGTVNEFLRYEDYRRHLARRRIAAAAGLILLLVVSRPCTELDSF